MTEDQKLSEYILYSTHPCQHLINLSSPRFCKEEIDHLSTLNSSDQDGTSALITKLHKRLNISQYRQRAEQDLEWWKAAVAQGDIIPLNKDNNGRFPEGLKVVGVHYHEIIS